MATKSTKGRARKAKAHNEGNGIAENPQDSPGRSTGNQQDAPRNEVPEQYDGPCVLLPLYFRHHRHWWASLPDAEPRPIDRQFLELEREGIACLYDTLNALVKEIYPHGSYMRRPTTAPNLGRWGDMQRERAEVERAWAANNGAVVYRVGPMLPTDPTGYVPPYGATYTRAQHQSVHSVMVPHVVTPEEAERDGMPKAAGLTAWTCDPTRRTTATAEQVGHRWAEVFTEEVRHLLGDEPGDQTLAAFARLTANLKGYVIGSKEGARVMEHMKAEGMGDEVLAAFGRIRERLKVLLDKVAEGHRSHGEPQHTLTVSEPQLETAPATFFELLGEENLATTLRAIEELGYRPVRRRGKGPLIAAMEAALENFEVKLPLAKHWPYMLNMQFPAIEAGTKAYPPLKATQRTREQKEARTAMLDLLNR